MKKKKYLLILFLLVLFNKIELANAEAAVNVCEYDNSDLKVTFDESGTATINQEFYEEKTIPWVLNSLYNYSSGLIDATDSLEFQEKELLGSCPEKLYVCKYEETSINSGLANIFTKENGRINVLSKVYIFYSESEMKKNNNLASLKNDEVTYGSEFLDAITEGYKACSGYGIPVLEQITGALCALGNEVITTIKSTWSTEDFYIKYKNCFNTKYIGEGPTYNLACPNLNVYLGRFNDAINKYKECDKTDAICISQTITNVKKQEDLIKKYCSSITQSHNYDGGTEQDCLEACIGIGVQTAKAKKSAGLLSTDSGQCGFSARLLVWISNILRWIKYILPVAVIIFGIIDFIKAISADKEDEMKKAQKRFIIRLIAAALVFIIPLIIEFILDKMGFGYDSCGLF